MAIDVGDFWLSSEQAPSASQRCGLFVTDATQRPLPLRRRSVSATVFAEHGFAEVSEELAYVSDEDCTVRFVFPLPPRAAVYKFAAVIGDRKVVTEVKRKEVAQAEYDEALSQGHTAVQLKQQAGAQLYSVDVGNLFGMEAAVITFSYVRIHNTVAGAVEFEHQATWVPPYLKSSELDAQGSPLPHVAESNPVFASKVSYTLSYCIKVHSGRGFKAIESPSPVNVSEGADGNVRIVTLSEAVSDPSRDLTLLIELPPLSADRSHAGQLLLQECERPGGKRKTVALATFIPRLPRPPAGHAPPAREIIFLLDGSGSMGGSPIAQALEAALFFVKDLPAGGNIAFNAVMFGSGHTSMWEAPRKYDQATQQEAVAWLQRNVNADYGGTEVLSVLKAIYATPLAASASRQVIFLTDGGVSGNEEASIYALVEGKDGGAVAREVAPRTTIFSLGIGHGVHRGLVEGVAKRTGGVAQFVVDGESIGRKAGMLKRCALAAADEGGCLAKPRLVSRSCIMRAAPNVLPPRLFPDEPTHVLVEIAKSEPGACLDLSATTIGPSGDGRPYSVSLPLDSAVHIPGDAFAVLHAMSTIGGLMGGTSALHCGSDGAPLPSGPPDASRVTEAVVALALEEGLITPHTSAVGVLLQRDPLDPSQVKHVEVPLQVPAGRTLWQSQHSAHNSGPYGGALMRRCAMPPPGAMAMSGRGGGRGGGAARKMSKCATVTNSISSSSSSSSPGHAAAFSSADWALASAAFKCQTQVLSADEFKSSKRDGERSRERGQGGGLWSSVTSGLSGVFSKAKGVSSPPQLAPAAPAAAVAAIRAPKPALAPDTKAVEAKCQADAYDDDEEEAESVGGRSLETADEVMAEVSKECGQQQQQQQAPAPQFATTPVGLPSEAVLSLLNLRRTVHGCVAASPEVLQALAGKAYDALQQQGSSVSFPDFASGLLSAGCRPASLASDDAWVTVLALAYLRKHLAAEATVWAGLEAKALEFLASLWPADAGRSVGSAVLAAIKLV